MEQEYKWLIIDEEKINNIINSKLVIQYITNEFKVDMEAIYYDDINETIKKAKGALRKRKQNGDTICCLKIEQKSENDCKKREEYEIEEENIYKALEQFPNIGAPRELCEKIRKKNLIELCKLKFYRHVYELKVADNCILELSFDRGMMIRGKNKQNFIEMELEFKSGDEEKFHVYAHKLENKFDLRTQPLSKIARAMKL